VQLFGKHVVVTPIDNTTIITLVSLVLFGKAIFSGFDLVDKIKQRVATVAKTIEEKTDDSSSTNSPT
jgi:hypothetical protein